LAKAYVAAGAVVDNVLGAELGQRTIDVDGVPVKRCRETVKPGWLVNDTCRRGIGFFRRYAGVAA